MLLETLVLATKLFSAQPSLPSDQYILQNQDRNPAVNAQASKENLSGGPKEDAIKKIGDNYKKLVIDRDAGKKLIEDARNFYAGVIKNHQKNPYVQEAYLNLGKIICCIKEPQNYYGGAEKIKKAYELASNINTKVDALLLLGFLHRDNAATDSRFSLKEAKEYFQKIIELAPESYIALESKKMLKEIQAKKTQ